MSKVTSVAGSSVLGNVLGTLTLIVTTYAALTSPSASWPTTGGTPMVANTGGVGLQHSILLVVAGVIGLGLLLPSWIALVRALRLPNKPKEVESPLERSANGVLRWKDWKLGDFEQIANKAFVNAEIPLDGKRYIDCTFEHCTFVYEGTAPFEIVGDASGIIRKNPDDRNVALRSANPIVMSAWQLYIKTGQGGTGFKGMWFEPAN
jgi:hypothetical protein